ncbi:hypothetical protein LXL04_029053 [Taraxacum kok-saghyz]
MQVTTRSSEEDLTGVKICMEQPKTGVLGFHRSPHCWWLKNTIIWKTRMMHYIAGKDNGGVVWRSIIEGPHVVTRVARVDAGARIFVWIEICNIWNKKRNIDYKNEKKRRKVIEYFQMKYESPLRRLRDLDIKKDVLAIVHIIEINAHVKVKRVVKENNVLIVEGTWIFANFHCFMINVYAPQADVDKRALWDKISLFMDNNVGDYIVFGDFNAVRHRDERLGRAFSQK